MLAQNQDVLLPSLFGAAKAAGDNDVKLGEVGGAPFGQGQHEVWKHTDLIIDVVPERGRMFIMAYMIISPLARRAVTGLCWLVAIMAGLLGFQRVRLAIGRVGPFSLRSRFALPVSALTFCAGPPLSSSGACDRVPRPKKRASRRSFSRLLAPCLSDFWLLLASISASSGPPFRSASSYLVTS